MKRCGLGKMPVQSETKRWTGSPVFCAALIIVLVMSCGDADTTPLGDDETEINPQWVADDWTSSPLPAISGVDWDALNTGRDTAYLNDFEKEAIAWYNLAKVYPQEFYRQIANDNATTYARNSDLQSATSTSQASVPSKALLLAAREYASVFNSTWEFDCDEYAYLDGLRDDSRRRYAADRPEGFFGLLVDLENGGSPKLLVAKVVRLCGEWGEGSLVGITRQGNYGVLVIAQSVEEMADAPDTPSYDQSRIAPASMLTNFTDNGGSRTLNVKQIALDAIGAGGTDREKITRVNTWLSNTLDYAYPQSSRYYDEHPAGNTNASKVLAYATLPQRDPAYWRWCVCEGYARTMVGMLRELGIKARTIGGYAFTNSNPGGGGHAWVQVYVDGAWTMCDPTWNDTARSSNGWMYLPGVNGDDFSNPTSPVTPFEHSIRL
jgi:hypothetical protein